MSRVGWDKADCGSDRTVVVVPDNMIEEVTKALAKDHSELTIAVTTAGELLGQELKGADSDCALAAEHLNGVISNTLIEEPDRPPCNRRERRLASRGKNYLP